MILDTTEVVLWTLVLYLVTLVVTLLIYSVNQSRRSSTNFLTSECFARMILPEMLVLAATLSGGFFIQWLVQSTGASKDLTLVLSPLMGILLFVLHSKVARSAHARTSERRRALERPRSTE